MNDLVYILWVLYKKKKNPRRRWQVHVTILL